MEPNQAEADIANTRAPTSPLARHLNPPPGQIFDANVPSENQTYRTFFAIGVGRAPVLPKYRISHPEEIKTHARRARRASTTVAAPPSGA